MVQASIDLFRYSALATSTGIIFIEVFGEHFVPTFCSTAVLNALALPLVPVEVLYPKIIHSM